MFRKIWNKLHDIIDDPAVLLLIVTGLCIALAFALGFAVIGFSEARNADRDAKAAKRNATPAAIAAVIQKVSTQAANKACMKTKHKNTVLFTSLQAAFAHSTLIADKALAKTPKTSPFYKPRQESSKNYANITRIIGDYLPIKCGTNLKTKSTGSTKHS